MAAKRTAVAHWDGNLATGQGTVLGESGALPKVPVSWVSRTEQPGGKTSPEELLAAALASCFSMALTARLTRAQKPPTSLDVRVTSTFDKVGDAWKVTTMEIDVTGRVAGMDATEFALEAEAAGGGCPISGALKGNVEIQTTAHLAGA